MLVITSTSPVLLTYTFILWIEDKSLKKIFLILLLLLILVSISILIIFISKRKLEVITFPITSIKTADSEVFGFFLAYLFPFISLTSKKINEPVLIFILILFLLIIWGTHSYHTNPLLTILGYHFYEVETPGNVSYLLITRRDLRNTKDIDLVVQISEYMVLDIE